MRVLAAAFTLLALLGCETRVQGPSPGDASRSGDAGRLDASAVDLPRSWDASLPDSAGVDASSTVDAGMIDVATPDSQLGSDAAVADATVADAATPDSFVPDTGCLACPEDTEAACSDHISNDGDSYVDCRDFDCAAVWPCNIPEDGQAACTDGHDNDGDGYLDCEDYSCDPVWPCNIPEDDASACTDGYDNDGDGATDCDDLACEHQPVCLNYENTAETCRDGVNNDGDAFTDCADPDCQGLSVCLSYEDTVATCSDRVDNDGDGHFDCRDPGCAALTHCLVGRIRVASWNVNELGAVGSTSYNATLAVLQRIDADLVCLQEVLEEENATLASLAASAGYPHHFQGAVSTPMSGGLTNACLSRLPLLTSRSRSSDDISSDPSANETGRDIVELRVEVQPGSLYLGVTTVHLKAGFMDADRFRRQIEARRLAELVEGQAVDQPGEPRLALGDFNAQIDDSDLGQSFARFPTGMPLSYRLGSDVSWPVVYQPFARLFAAGLQVADAGLEDRPGEQATRFGFSRRIDYLLVAGAQVEGAELYDACEDDGVDDAPLGDWLPKAGAPLPCGTAEAASDHRPLFADLVFP